MKKFFKEYIEEFDKLTLDLPRRKGGISRSEAFAFCGLCKMHQIDLVIDSGTGRGISTEYFSRTLDHVITIDNHQHYNNSLAISLETLRPYNNILFIIGNSYIIIPFLLQTMKHEKCAIFFDGPKGSRAYELAKGLDIVFAGFHDATPNKPDGIFLKNKGSFFNTLDDWFLEEYSWLNKNRGIGGFPNGPGVSFIQWRE